MFHFEADTFLPFYDINKGNSLMTIPCITTCIIAKSRRFCFVLPLCATNDKFPHQKPNYTQSQRALHLRWNRWITRKTTKIRFSYHTIKNRATCIQCVIFYMYYLQCFPNIQDKKNVNYFRTEYLVPSSLCRWVYRIFQNVNIH